MRSEQEMMDLIIGAAEKDTRIMAAYMGGSRTNPKARKDIFQDFDVVFVVKETKPFIEDKNWIDQFGERLIMQYPDENVYYDSDKTAAYGWLMQFCDGNRIDLHVVTLEYAKKDIASDMLCRMLLDKEGLLPPIPPATDQSHWVKKPTQQEFKCTCNEFWWLMVNVAKGLWRKEVPYVQQMINFHVRPQLVRLLSWEIGIKENFTCSIGKAGKDMYKWLSDEEWQCFLETYTDAETKNIWCAVEKMCSLFYQTEKVVAESLKYDYEEQEAKNMIAYLSHVKEMPEDAVEIYE